MPLEAAHLRNKQVVEELRTLREQSSVLAGQAPDFANYYPKMIANLQRVYTQLQAAVDALQFIGLEGIQEVTFRSRTETLTWAPSTAASNDMAAGLLEHLSERLSDVEERIVEAKARLAGELTGGTAEEWHHENVHSLALLLEAVPTLSDSPQQ
jgi:hypothetical protein